MVSQLAYKKGPRVLYQYRSVLISNIILVVRVYVVSVVLLNSIVRIIYLSLPVDRLYIYHYQSIKFAFLAYNN